MEELKGFLGQNGLDITRPAALHFNNVRDLLRADIQIMWGSVMVELDHNKPENVWAFKLPEIEYLCKAMEQLNMMEEDLTEEPVMYDLIKDYGIWCGINTMEGIEISHITPMSYLITGLEDGNITITKTKAREFLEHFYKNPIQIGDLLGSLNWE